MNFEDAIREAFETLDIGELIIRETIGDEFQIIAKSKKAMTGPWGCGSDKDVPRAIKKAFVSLAGELQHQRDYVKSFASKPKPKKRRDNDLI